MIMIVAGFMQMGAPCVVGRGGHLCALGMLHADHSMDGADHARGRAPY